MRQGAILRKMRRLNYEDGTNVDDQLVHTAAYGKLFEYLVTGGHDVVADAGKPWPPLAREPDCKDGEEKGEDKGKWVCRGSGHVKFIKCLEEGYNYGMVRMELTKNGTLEILMCHELIHEEVLPMPSKKGKAYTWHCKKDWAYRTARRTFAVRFDDDMDAMDWKARAERSKGNNERVRRSRGLDVTDLGGNKEEEEDFCSDFQKRLSTVAGGGGTA